MAACQCNQLGSKNGNCDTQTGQCDCHLNVAMSGQRNTEDDVNDRQCTACIANFYGFGKAEGCLPCNCDQTGSTGSQCDNDGQCPCKETIDGRQCNKCKPSYFYFSVNGCQPCNCSTAGSQSTECNQLLGTCSCKGNVESGGKCHQCKDGFYNLAEYNPVGCQPCFCFGHGESCKSALGFSEKTLSVASTNDWKSENDFIMAPDTFLGDHHSSYGQLLTFQLGKNGMDIKLQNKALVTVKGHGFVLDHFGDKSADGTEDVTVSVRLFPLFWIIRSKGRNPTSNEMYRILASLEKLTIRKSVGSNQLTVSQVSMVTAKMGDENPTTMVEDCTCKPNEYVSGTSCQNCTGGYRRYNQSTLTPYDTCVQCSCANRATECDENSGTCLSCRNGTVGDHCESCAANVVAPDCSQCEDGFYGLGQDGCRACACSDDGSRSSVCEKGTGQCLCTSHVTGRTCDVCEDNYHSLTKDVGCTVCTGCYDLVGDEVVKIRQLQNNLTAVITDLEANDNTASLDSFDVRLATAHLSMSQLLKFLQTAEASEETILGKLSAFNSTIRYLSTAVDAVETEKKASITSSLNEAQTNIQKAINTKKEIQAYLIQINKLIGPLEVTGASLNSLVSSLQEVEAYLQSLSQSSTTDMQSVLQTVSSIETTSAEAKKQAENLLQVVQSMLAKHDKNGRAITTLEGAVVTLKSLGVTTNDEARRVILKSNSMLTTASSLQNTTQSLATSDVDFASLTTQLTDLKSRADATYTQATTGTADLQKQQQTFLQASSRAEQQRMNTVNMVTEGDRLEERAVTASRKATDAKRDSDAVFSSAQNMLDIMRNFDTRATAVEAQANTALLNVQTLDASSQQVINEANTIINSLVTTQQSASLAKEVARQAKAVAQQLKEGMKSIWNDSQATIASLNQEFADITTKSGQTQEVTNTIVKPAQTLCDSYDTGIADATAKTAMASSATANTTSAVNSINKQASKILNDLRNLGSIDTARIAELQKEVAASPNRFDSQTLAAVIAVIKEEFDLQSEWLQTTRQKKSNIVQEIIQLRAVQGSIKP